METLTLILLATVAVSILSLSGVFLFLLKYRSLEHILLILVGFSAGTFLGGAFLHLLPESIETIGILAFIYSLVGFSLFFILERILRWHHCHKEKCEVHTFTYMNLIGDGVHNFIDGLIIAISFVTSTSLGMITTIAIVAHEIPQEIGDFAVLIYGGFKKLKAILFNLLSALTAVIGALLGYFLSSHITWIVPFLIPFAAGGFIYIATSDLIPELHKEPNLKKSMISFLFFLFGIIFMLIIKLIFEH